MHQELSLGGEGGADHEAIYNLYLVVKKLL